MTARKNVRCAVYTRKSTEHNLDLEFNSLDAQREACEAYIKSQLHEGWVLVPDRYDDGGISGGSLDRPDLQRLLADIRAGRVDIVVVYKVDRLTRSLTDFAKLVELFDAHKVSFVSITQAFNTTTSMGRLTLNVLLSFAQFEREVIGERVRDKIAASKAKGLWMGGNVPLGYVSQAKKLVILPEEAETVRLIYRRYLELGSIGLLLEDLRRKGIKTKRRVGADGRVYGGGDFGTGSLTHLLKNRLFIAEITHRDLVHAADHQPLLDRDLFEAVQAKLQKNKVARKLELKSTSYLLTGLLFDSAGNLMSPSHSVKKGVRYRYYVSQGLLQNRRGSELGEITRVSSPDIEDVITGFLHQRTRVVGDLADALRVHVHKIVVHAGALEVYLSLAGDGSTDGHRVALSWQPRVGCLEKGVAHKPAQPGGDDARSRETLLCAIANARRWLNELLEGATILEIAQAAGVGMRQTRTLLNLAFVPPAEIRRLLDGSGPVPTVTELAGRVPLVWQVA